MYSQILTDAHLKGLSDVSTFIGFQHIRHVVFHHRVLSLPLSPCLYADCF